LQDLDWWVNYLCKSSSQLVQTPNLRTLPDNTSKPVLMVKFVPSFHADLSKQRSTVTNRASKEARVRGWEAASEAPWGETCTYRAVSKSSDRQQGLTDCQWAPSSGHYH
jgi:O6-methylguanine-DNA--protein-cysteine methyltransferase